MKRIGVVLAAVLSVTAICAATAAAAQAAYTWEGTWNSSFGPLTMDAGGDGSYPNYSGTIDGSVSGIDGRTNSGTWTEPSSDGTFVFNMNEAGTGFTGTWERTGGGCTFPPCTWDGICTAGACLENGPAEPPVCDESSVFGCRWAIRFGFDTRRGMPASPRANALPQKLLAIALETDGARLLAEERNPFLGEWQARGHLIMRTFYREPGPGHDRRKIDFFIEPPGTYEKEEDKITLSTRLSIFESTDPKCPERSDPYQFAGQLKLKARRLDSGRKAVKAIFDPIPNRHGNVVKCVAIDRFEELVWKTDDFSRFRIGRPERIGVT
jgi:hypothetical protein